MRSRPRLRRCNRRSAPRYRETRRRILRALAKSLTEASRQQSVPCLLLSTRCSCARLVVRRSNLIAISWQPQYGRNHTMSVIADIMKRHAQWNQNHAERQQLSQRVVELKKSMRRQSTEASYGLASAVDCLTQGATCGAQQLAGGAQQLGGGAQQLVTWRRFRRSIAEIWQRSTKIAQSPGISISRTTKKPVVAMTLAQKPGDTTGSASEKGSWV